MITSFKVGNFKAFSEAQEIPLKPITLIFGPNSSGKSSILHSLLLMHEANRTGSFDVRQTELSGDEIDLGGFAQFIHQQDLERTFEWSVELASGSLPDSLKALFPSGQDIHLRVVAKQPREELKRMRAVPQSDGQRREVPFPTGHLVRSGPPVIARLEIGTTDGVFMSLAQRGAGEFEVVEVAEKHPATRALLAGLLALTTSASEPNAETKEAFAAALADVLPSLRYSVDGFLPIRKRGESAAHADSLMPLSRGNLAEDMGRAVATFLPRRLADVVEGIGQIVRTGLGQLRYLGPLRSLPDRHTAFGHEPKPAHYASGEAAWWLLANHDEVREKVNDWLRLPDFSTRYHLEVQRFHTLNSLSPALKEAQEDIVNSGVQDLLRGQDDNWKEFADHFAEHSYSDEDPTGLLEEELRQQLKARLEYETNFKEWTLPQLEQTVRELVPDAPGDIVLRSGNVVVSHRDVGIGISQVLPILVYASHFKNTTLAIEQPEIHFHPALQAELGDVFIESALGPNGNRFLIETHSEHLLLRIMRRIRESHLASKPNEKPRITIDDVCVLYVDPLPGGSLVRHMPLNQAGELVKSWPGGFFEEGLDELFPSET